MRTSLKSLIALCLNSSSGFVTLIFYAGYSYVGFSSFGYLWSLSIEVLGVLIEITLAVTFKEFLVTVRVAFE